MELDADDLKYFVPFLLLDHAWRFPSGKRPKDPFVGFWSAYHKRVKNMRGRHGDSARRRRVCIRALDKIAKKSLSKAATEVADFLFLKNFPRIRNDNSSRGPNAIRRGTVKEADSIRTDYEEYGCDDATWDRFVSQFVTWRNWVLSEDGNTAFQAMQKRVEELKEFRGEVIPKDRVDSIKSLVIAIRKDVVQQERNQQLILESAAAAKLRIESGFWNKPTQSRPVDWQSPANDFWRLGQFLAKTNPQSATRYLKKALQLWIKNGIDLAPQVRNRAINALQAEIAGLRGKV